MRKTTVTFSLLLAVLLAIVGTFMERRGQAGGKSNPVTVTGNEANTAPALTSLLNPDGTLDLSRGFNGSLNPQGFRMEYAENGAPRFVSVAPAVGEIWDPQFVNANGVQTSGYAVAVIGTDVYVGGSPLVTVGSLGASGIAKWDGSSWSTLGNNSLSGSVYALAVSGTNLYVGGNFSVTTITGSTNDIAKWDGSNWLKVGSGISDANSYVLGIAVSGSDLYIGGQFSSVSGVSASNIAKWNGSAWSALGGGTDSRVVAVAVSGSNVYAGGEFSTAGGNAASFIARWNGSAWSALGSGMDFHVQSLAVSGADLYAGGTFSTAGGVSAKGIARWNGSAWSALGTGLLDSSSFPANVRSLLIIGEHLYAAGNIATAGGTPASGIARWNGTWSALGSGLVNGAFNNGDNAYSIAALGSDLYVAGNFSKAGGSEANRIARWDGSAWSPLGNNTNSVNRPVYAIAVSGTDVYVGGEFDFAGGVAANNIAKWNGVSWSALGSGVNRLVRALAVSGNDVYAGGHFTTAGGSPANLVARWNGSAWSALGSGITNADAVRSLAVIGTNLYAGGTFFTAGGNSVSNIACWNGSAWSALGSGLNGFFDVGLAMAVIGNDLYVGGNFTDAGGVANTVNIAKWNGSAWSAVGGGTNNTVRTLAVSGTDVYAGGDFSMAGGNSASGVAKWNGSAWSALGAGVSSGSANALAAVGNDLYVGGSFALAGGSPARYLAKWNGSSWSAPGGASGTDNILYALGLQGTTLFAGGEFTQIGGVRSHFFGRSADNTPPTITAQAGVTRQQGAGVSNSQIATVADTESGANGVTVTVNGSNSATVNGVTVSGIVNSGGTVTANIVAICGATNASFTLTATDGNNATATATLNVAVTGISVNPATLVNGLTFIPYTATLSATGGSGTYTFSLASGSLPAGLTLSGNTISGSPTMAGASTFTIRADDDGNTCFGERTYTVNIGSTGLMYYPLARPVRLLDTRPGASPNACSQPNAQIPGATSFTQAARGTCDGITIPANATTLTGNVTIVQPAGNGFLTLYPGDAPKPDVANSNYLAGETLNNAFTVGLGVSDGTFKIFVNSTTHVVIDVTGFYAPPATGGLYFHPLPKPIRLLETRQGFTGCQATGTPLLAGSTRLQTGVLTCDGVTIPTGAQALVGNATTTNSAGNGYLTLYPGDATQPFIASSNYLAGVNRNAPFTVGLSLNGEFNIFTSATTDLVIDVMGYFSTQAMDANGQGLLFNSLGSPLRLLDTRAGSPACYTPGSPMTGGTVYTQDTQIPCTNLTATARALVGNVSAVNAVANGYLTFWPSDAAQPTTATSNYQTGRVFNRHFTVGLGPDVAFKRFTSSTTDLIIDISGFFAP